MRSIILAAALMAVVPVAYTQTTQPRDHRHIPTGAGTKTYPSATGTGKTGDLPTGSAATPSSGTMPTGSAAAPSRSAMNAQPNPENCGTPDEPKACPPMPRRALSH